MAKPIIVVLDGIESSFDHAKVERTKLYGSRRRVPLDLDGQGCVKSALTTDGLYLLQTGMTAQGYFDEAGRWLQKNQLVGIGEDGQALELKPSTLGAAQPLESVAPSSVLDHAVDAVYALDPMTLDAALKQRLEAGEVFSFKFKYGADFRLDTAFLLHNSEGIFCLVGTPISPVWAEPGKVSVLEDEEESADELNFDMF
ncbi:MAG: hypothetical protein WAV95_08790 [Azonexus sp.]